MSKKYSTEDIEELFDEATIHELDPEADFTWASVAEDEDEEGSDDMGINDYD